jgi:DnaK suppressor protein
MARKEALMSLREILVNRRDALRMALTGDMSLLNELASQTKGDVVDWALDAAYNELGSQLAEVESRELVMIENALKRMKQGDYGVCEGCEGDIPLARLQALPYATHCIQCQRLSEQNGGRGAADVDWSRVVDMPGDDLRRQDFDINVS